MNLDEKLAKWNGGQLHAAAARFARKIDVKQNLVSLWRSGTMPGEKYAPRVCKELGITPAELVALINASRTKDSIGFPSMGAGAMTVRDSAYDFLEIPHLGVVRADRFSFSFDVPPENFTTLAVKAKAGERYAMLRISGECMSPRIEDGDEVLIRQTDEVPDGTIAIVCFDGECTLKRVYKKKDGVELRADNPEYESKRYASSKVRVLAEVVKIIKDPRRRP